MAGPAVEDEEVPGEVTQGKDGQHVALGDPAGLLPAVRKPSSKGPVPWEGDFFGLRDRHVFGLFGQMAKALGLRYVADVISMLYMVAYFAVTYLMWTRGAQVWEMTTSVAVDTRPLVARIGMGADSSSGWATAALRVAVEGCELAGLQGAASALRGIPTTLSVPVGVPLYMMAWSFMCYLSFAGAVMTHNTMHVPVFFSRHANKVFQVLLTLTYGHPVSSYVPGHNLSHHKYTQLRKDVMRTSKVNYKSNLVNLLLFKWSVVGDVMKSDINYLLVQKEVSRPYFKQAMREVLVLAGVTLRLATLSPFRWITLWQLPHLFAQWGIVTMNHLQHDGCNVAKEGSAAPKSKDFDYNCARNFTSRFLGWTAFNNGYHTVHHAYPTIHWSQLPEMHAKVIRPHMHPNLEWASMAGYIWWSTVSPGKRVDFLGNPVTFDDESMGPDQPWIEHPHGSLAEKDDAPRPRVLSTIGGGIATTIAEDVEFACRFIFGLPKKSL